MAKSKADQLTQAVDDLQVEVRALRDLPSKVDTVILALGGSPLVTDEKNPHHPANSVVGQVRAGVDRQKRFEEKVQAALQAISQAGTQLSDAVEELKKEFSTKVEVLEKSTINKKTIGQFFWKYKVRIGLVLLLLILEGPKAWSWVVEILKDRYA